MKRCKECGQGVPETFDAREIANAIEQWLDWGEKEYGKAQGGYFSGGGWAARCLRYHLEEIKKTLN